MENQVTLDLQGQAEVWKRIFSFAESMALKCVVELGIPDILHTHNRPVSLPEIAASLASSSPDLSCLGRVMRLLVNSKVFTMEYAPSGGDEPLYGLTSISKWLLRDSNWSLAPMLLFQLNEHALTPWLRFGECIAEGGDAFAKANGCAIWELAAKQPSFNKTFNSGLASFVPIATRSILEGYRDGFFSLKGTVIDVGGGSGGFMAEIVKHCPHINAINFDLPHVVASAPAHPRVTHLGGNMFGDIPKADAIVLKSVLHDWGDEDCVKILKNCRRALDPKTGKLIIIDIVLEPEEDDPFVSARLTIDLVMMAHCGKGQERTKSQLKKILEEGGFAHHRIIKVPALPSVIEAFPM